MRRSRAYTLIEILISVMIIFIIGATAMTMFWVIWASYWGDRDYIDAREEVEFAFQLLARDMTNISLGMPNNREGSGDFSESFRGDGGNDANSPIMFFMGQDGAEWGGPILLRWHPDGNPDYFNNSHRVTTTINYANNDVYVGNELIYATAIPATFTMGGVRSTLKVSADNVGNFSNGDTRTFTILQEEGVENLVAYNAGIDDGRHAEIIAGNTTQRNPNSWLVLPGLQLPLRIDGWRINSSSSAGAAPAIDNSLQLTVAPNSSLPLTGTLGGLEEIYLVKAARIFVNENRQLVQEIYGENFDDVPSGSETATRSTVRRLADNVADVVFIFDPAMRTLTMHIAVFGNEVEPIGGGGARGVQPALWPVTGDTATDDNIALPDELLQRRIVIGSRTWRIRN